MDPKWSVSHAHSKIIGNSNSWDSLIAENPTMNVLSRKGCLLAPHLWKSPQVGLLLGQLDSGLRGLWALCLGISLALLTPFSDRFSPCVARWQNSPFFYPHVPQGKARITLAEAATKILLSLIGSHKSFPDQLADCGQGSIMCWLVKLRLPQEVGLGWGCFTESTGAERGGIPIWIK